MKLKKRSNVENTIESYACDCSACGCASDCVILIYPSASSQEQAYDLGYNQSVAGGYSK